MSTVRAMAIIWLAVAAACARQESFERPLEYGSVDDVRAVLASGGAKSLQLDCRNVRYATGEVIRSVACTTAISERELATLVDSLRLSPGPAFNSGMRDACESRHGLRSVDAGVDVLVGTNTRVTNGVGRIEIHVVRATGAACIEITYPWS